MHRGNSWLQVGLLSMGLTSVACAALPPRPFLNLTRPLLFAHGGGGKEAPENTMVAYAQALAAGADVLEIDVHMSKDGQVVVIHDESVERTTSGQGRVRDLTYTELSSLDASAKFVDEHGENPFKNKDVRIPRLLDLLLRFHAAGINIEVKQEDPPMLPALFAVLRQAEEQVGPLQVLLTSANEHVKAALEAAHAPYALGMSYAEAERFVWQAHNSSHISRDLRRRALQIPTTYKGMPIVTDAVRRAAREAEVPIHLWVIDSPAEAESWLKLGDIDGIMTDAPRALAPVFAAFKPPGTAKPAQAQRPPAESRFSGYTFADREARAQPSSRPAPAP